MKTYSIYTCSLCADEFTSTWSHEEVTTEYENLFPEYQGQKTVIICDDCFEKIDIDELKRQHVNQEG